MVVLVSHILVKHQYEAEDIQKLLKQGKDFSELARRRSLCSSSVQGGYLGNILSSNIDEDFLAAAQSLPLGEISGIVKTRFGYHLIKRQ